MKAITTLHRLLATATARMPRLYAAARITAALALALFLVACDKPHH
jgi:hypothetical protein